MPAFMRSHVYSSMIPLARLRRSGNCCASYSYLRIEPDRRFGIAYRWYPLVICGAHIAHFFAMLHDPWGGRLHGLERLY